MVLRWARFAQVAYIVSFGNSEVPFLTYMLTILSPILLVDSRLMLSPSDSNLSLSLLAERRCKPCSGFGVRDPGVSAAG